MTNELKKLTKKIDKEFIEYFLSDVEVETIFVAGSMAYDDYQDREDNDYDIRVIAKEVNRDKIINFEKFLEELSRKLSTPSIEVGYSCLVGPVNHKVSSDKKNILIHAMIHRSDQMDGFLPVTHKYQYGSRYRIVYGKDSLERFQNIRYNIDELVNAHEGLYYCIDMLKHKEYRYLTWDTDNNKCEFNYHFVEMTEDIVLEICFYSVNKFVDNLINYCKWENYEITENKVIFCIRLLGQENVNESILFLLQGLLTKSESLLKAIFHDPLQETINLLEKFVQKVYLIDNIFPKKELEKVKKLARS
ncbi:MAG: hypothetical protein IKN63_00675 [Bacilli bacterium]|nr:hypothetical protein [Bacilli bacterium]